MYFDQAEFGKRIADQRKINNLTQEDLAERLGVNKMHISRMERGAAACSIDLLLEMASVLQTSTDYLLIGKNPDKEITRLQLKSVIRQLSFIANSI